MQPTSKSTAAPLSASIQLNGLALNDYYVFLSASVVYETGIPSEARLVLTCSSGDADTVINTEYLEIDDTIELIVGYGAGNENCIFSGTISNYIIDISTNTAQTVTIFCSNSDTTNLADANADAPLKLTMGESIISFSGKVAAEISGQVTFSGTPLASVGTTLLLAGLGKKFDGNTVITYVNHDIAEGNWITTAKFSKAEMK